MRRWLLPTLLALLSGPVAAAPPAGPEPEAPTRAAVAWLRSPFLREREEAARLLIGLLPGSRAAILEAWRAGDEGVRTSLCPVLEAEGSAECVGLLLDAWCRGGDALAAGARQALIQDPVATRKGLAAYRAEHPTGAGGAVRRPLEAVDGLLARDHVERLFLERKSRSGGTGVYRGQYEALRPWRATALEMAFGVLTDRALRLPGTSAVGGYRFLNPVSDVFDVWEIRSMALYALADLLDAGDTEWIARLDAYLADLREMPRGDGTGSGGRPERDAFYDDLLVTLYRLHPARYREELERELEYLEQFRGYAPLAHQAIAMQLRIGRYADAVSGYQDLLFSSVSRASDYYNLACAYAQWSLQPGPRDPAHLRRQALLCLENAVGEQWTDVSWMEQDRDLDPIRDSAEYRTLVQRIRETLASDRPAPRAPVAPRPLPRRR